MLPEPLDLHCIGGFVICFFYGLPRPTGDIDYYSAVPANLNLIEMADEQVVHERFAKTVPPGSSSVSKNPRSGRAD